MANKRRLPNLIIENAEIRFRNFAGEEGTYNRKGDRNFCVLLDPAVVPTMLEDGWNIKYLKPREEGDEPRPYIQVAVRFDNFPPNVVMITSRGRTNLGEEQVMILDWADIKQVDLTINPSPWEVNGKSGIKAYLKSMYVTIEEDRLDLKYADVPESAQTAMVGNTGYQGSATQQDDAPPW